MACALLALAVVPACGCSGATPVPQLPQLPVGVTPEQVREGLCALQAARFYDLPKLTPEQGVQLALDLAACVPRTATPAADAGAQ